MKEDLLKILECPVCHRKLKIGKIRDIYLPSLGIPESIKTGILICTSCNKRILIKEEIPILSKETEKDDRRLILKIESDKGEIRRMERGDLSTKEKEKILERKIRRLLPFDEVISKRAEKRLERDLEYRVRFTEKDKYVYTFKPYLTKSPQTVLELGIGQGGFLTSARKILKPKICIGLDTSFNWAEIAKIRDPKTEIIVANAEDIPIQKNSIDLVISAYLLEHMRNWQKVIRETRRITHEAFFIFGPNKLFFYDYGHMGGVPLITFLPTKLGKYLVWLVQKVKGYRKDLKECTNELNSMSYISPFAFEKVVKKFSFSFSNLFLDFIRQTLKSRYQYWKIGYVLKRIEFLVIFGAKIASFLKIQPVLVYFLKKKNFKQSID